MSSSPLLRRAYSAGITNFFIGCSHLAHSCWPRVDQRLPPAGSGFSSRVDYLVCRLGPRLSLYRVLLRLAFPLFDSIRETSEAPSATAHQERSLQVTVVPFPDLFRLVRPRGTHHQFRFAKSLPERAPFLHLITRRVGRSSTPCSPQASISKTSVGRFPGVSCLRMFVRAAVNMPTSGSSWA